MSGDAADFLLICWIDSEIADNEARPSDWQIVDHQLQGGPAR